MAKGRRNFNSNGEATVDTPKVKISKESLKEAMILFTYLKPYKAKFIFGLVFIALSAFSTSIFPFLLGKMIDAAAPGTHLPQMPGTANIGEQIGFSLKDMQWSLNTI